MSISGHEVFCTRTLLCLTLAMGGVDRLAWGQPLPAGYAPAPAAAQGIQPLVAPGSPAPGVAISPAAAAAPGPATPPASAGVPFQLSPVEQQFVRQVLEMWEAESKKIETFNAAFERLEYHPVWFSASKPMIISRGRLSYAKPDKGSFKIEEILRWKNADPNVNAADAPGDYAVQTSEIGEHWVCDGKAIYEYDHRNKQLKETPLPENLRGASIVDGPLPFLFGAEADKLLERYWIRSPQSDANTIWLEAYPRWQTDAANYHHVEIILQRKTMQPAALQIHQPDGKERHVYTFSSPTVNGKLDGLFGGLFNAPRTPLGWKRVVVQDPVASAPAEAGDPIQR
jgi:TIGR03009 family protein